MTLIIFSCSKDDNVAQVEHDTRTTFIYNDEIFIVEEFQQKLSLMCGIDESQFSFVSDSLAFELTRPETNTKVLLHVKNYVDAIKYIR